MGLNNKSPRIIQISHDYLGPFVAVCRQYTRAFEDYDVTTLYLRGAFSSQVEKETGGDRVLFFDQKQGSLSGIKIKTLVRLYQLFSANQFDIVIAHRYKPLYLAGIMSYFFRDQLTVGVIHEHGVLKRRHRKLFLSFWRRKLKVFAVSAGVKRDLENDCPFLCNNEGPGGNERLFVLNHAMDIDRYQSKLLPREQARQQLGLSEPGLGKSAFIVGTLGRLVRKKRQDILIRSLEQLNEDIRLVIIGDGPQRTKLENLCRVKGLSEKVTFSGHKDDGYRYLRAFDVFVLPSGSEEAFGYVLLEAMMAHIPIIVSDCEGPKEIAGEDALLFKDGNAESLKQKIKAVKILDPDAVDDITQKNYRRLVENFSMGKFKAELLSVPFIAQRLKK